MALYHVKSNTVGDMTGTVTVFNSAGATTTAAATDLVRPLDWNSAHSQVITVSGNTAGASTASGTNIVFQGGNNVTASVNQGANAATIVFSGANTVAQTVQTQASGNIVGAGFTSTTTAGTAVVATQNSNGLSMGVPTIITNAITTARASNDAVGLNTALTAGPLAWTVNSNGLSLNAGSAAGTTSGFAGNNISGSITHNTAGINISLNHPAWLTTAAQVSHSHGNPTLALTNITGTTASASNGLTLSLSGVAAQTTQTQPAGNIAGVGTTFAGANVSGSMTLNSNGLNLSLSAPTPGGGAAVNVSAGTTSNNLQTIQFGDANGVSFGLNGSTVTASVNAGGGVTLSNYVPFQLAGSNSNFTALGQNSVHLQHLYVPAPVTMSNIELYARGTFASSTNSQVVAQTISYGLYSQGAGTNSTRMELMTGSTAQFSASFNSSTTAGFTMAAGGSTFQTATNNTSIFGSLTGAFHLYLPYAASMAPNVKYAVAILSSSATTVGTSPLRFSGFYGIPVITSNFGRLAATGAQSVSSTVIGDYDLGIYGTTTGALPANYANSNLGIAISRQKLFVQFEV